MLLCLNAGFINAAGFLAFSVLTTNVTGHAALFAVNVMAANWRMARMVALWVFLFFMGAFTSAMLIDRTGRNKPQAYALPIIIILLVLTLVMLRGDTFDHSIGLTEAFAGSLLFAMGAQNAMVSMISGSVVRTTHLTGMITDLGVDLSQVFLKSVVDKTLKRRLLLRSTIVAFFLFGGMLGAWLFMRYEFWSFLVPIVLLLITLFYDFSRTRLRLIARRISHASSPAKS